MTVAQRSALANTWLTDGSGSAGASSSPMPGGQQQKDHGEDSSSDDNHSHGSTEGLQKDLMETCE